MKVMNWKKNNKRENFLLLIVRMMMMIAITKIFSLNSSIDGVQEFFLSNEFNIIQILAKNQRRGRRWGRRRRRGLQNQIILLFFLLEGRLEDPWNRERREKWRSHFVDFEFRIEKLNQRIDFSVRHVARVDWLVFLVRILFSPNDFSPRHNCVMA